MATMIARVTAKPMLWPFFDRRAAGSGDLPDRRRSVKGAQRIPRGRCFACRREACQRSVPLPSPWETPAVTSVIVVIIVIVTQRWGRADAVIGFVGGAT
jgi:hypothetical protein